MKEESWSAVGNSVGNMETCLMCGCTAVPCLGWDGRVCPGCQEEAPEANARLIAAAPELIEALRLLERSASLEHVHHTAQHGHGPRPDLCQQCANIARARAAIAKAEGR